MTTARSARHTGSLDGEEGSILPLTIFYAVLSLALILLVVAATSLYIEHKRLLTVADGAALAGAEAFDLDAVEVADDGARPRLQSADVRGAVDDYVAAEGEARFDELALEEAASLDGTSATVRIAATWHPPVVSLFVPDGIRISVTSVARSVFW